MYEEKLKYSHDSSSEDSHSLGNSLHSNDYITREKVSGSDIYNRSNSLDSEHELHAT